uniref:Uncharacterized protein n=1 Tax=Cacopsylla melanoneura TaxID=428564 RepID=A0A8D9DV71_9HEMI
MILSCSISFSLSSSSSISFRAAARMSMILLSTSLLLFFSALDFLFFFFIESTLSSSLSSLSLVSSFLDFFLLRTFRCRLVVLSASFCSRILSTTSSLILCTRIGSISCDCSQ